MVRTSVEHHYPTPPPPLWAPLSTFPVFSQGRGGWHARNLEVREQGRGPGTPNPVCPRRRAQGRGRGGARKGGEGRCPGGGRPRTEGWSFCALSLVRRACAQREGEAGHVNGRGSSRKRKGEPTTKEAEKEVEKAIGGRARQEQCQGRLRAPASPNPLMAEVTVMTQMQLSSSSQLQGTLSEKMRKMRFQVCIYRPSPEFLDFDEHESLRYSRRH
jgi:hypothetical protein